MINGVEVLSTNALTTVSTGWFLLSIIGACMIGTGLWIVTTFDCGNIVAGIIVSVCGLLIVVSTVVSGKLTKPTDKYEYKVTISDEVNFNEFNEKYEVTSQEGKIYTIVERED